MRRFTGILLPLVAAALLAAGGARAEAAVVTYNIVDVGTFDSYATPNVGQTYSSGGAGFVGLYNTAAEGEEAFAHLFGLEDFDFSRTAAEVDISGLSGKTILSATLSYVLLDGFETTQDVTITSYTANGDIAYYWDAPDDLGSVVATSTTGANSIDVTALVAARVGAGANWLGLHLRGSDEFQWTYTYSGFDRNADSAEVRLTVEYADVSAVPEPSTFALAGVGALGLAGAVRRRRRAS